MSGIRFDAIYPTAEACAAEGCPNPPSRRLDLRLEIGAGESRWTAPISVSLCQQHAEAPLEHPSARIVTPGKGNP